MQQIRITRHGVGKLEKPMHQATASGGWLQRAARKNVPDAAARVFRGDPAQRLLPAGTPKHVLAEIARLLPWVDPAGLKRLPPVSIYAEHNCEILAIDVWDETCTDVAQAIADTAVSWLMEHDDEGAGWNVDSCITRLDVSRSSGDVYSIGTLRVGEERAKPDDIEFEVGHLVYEGLVASALRDPNAASILERLPSIDAGGFYLYRPPQLKEDQGISRKPLYYGTTFSLDLAINGAWCVGDGVLFGYGWVRRQS